MSCYSKFFDTLKNGVSTVKNHVKFILSSGSMAERICVKIEFFASLRGKTNKDSENIALTTGSSLENLYEILREKHPSAFQAPMNEYVFVVNGKKQDPKKILLLCDQDNVSVFPLVGGG